ncbi:PTS system mannitol-specific IIA component [Cytobacillus eiseniae]|uniref:Mannitol-specific phosphotransferase enzyme IIA component n=1 Tax=Cytobacillus eiseniae TaxID=762947 RepID=A0ABS4RDP8_9BACI|nr:PTS sugar transporter subunit IIA [Cytobacillus eiseniae]MBP2241018.1 PTS system mannitol-specific IIA component [Cytobacillus eiseniae]
MGLPILSVENIVLNQELASKEEAIQLAGNILVDRGYVQAEYVKKMHEREAMTSTFMGNFVAIPHGTDDAKKNVQESGISIIQVPNGVDFGDGNIVKLIFGIAGKGDEHLELLSKIAIVVSEVENVEKIAKAASKEEVLSFFEGVN